MGVVSLNQSNTIQNPCNSPLEFHVNLRPVHQDHRSVPVLGDKLSLHIVATVTSQITASRPHVAFYLPKGAIGRNVVPWNSTTAAQQILGELYFASPQKCYRYSPGKSAWHIVSAQYDWEVRAMGGEGGSGLGQGAEKSLSHELRLA